MAKQITTVAELPSLTPAEQAIADAVFDSWASGYGTGLQRFRTEILPLYVLNGVIVTSLRKELTARNRQRFVNNWKASKGSDLTLAEVDSAKDSADATFSRFARNAPEPGKTPKTRTTKGSQSASNGATTNATTGQASTLPADSSNAIPHVLMAQTQVRDVLASIAAVQADLVQFQENIRVTKQGRELIGSIAEKVAGLHALASTLAATLL